MTCLGRKCHPSKQVGEEAVSRPQRSQNSTLSKNSETKAPEMIFSNWAWHLLVGLLIKFPATGEAYTWVHREEAGTISNQWWSPDRELGEGESSHLSWPGPGLWMWILFLSLSIASAPLLQVIIGTWTTQWHVWLCLETDSMSVTSLYLSSLYNQDWCALSHM